MFGIYDTNDTTYLHAILDTSSCNTGTFSLSDHKKPIFFQEAGTASEEAGTVYWAYTHCLTLEPRQLLSNLAIDGSFLPTTLL